MNPAGGTQQTCEETEQRKWRDPAFPQLCIFTLTFSSVQWPQVAEAQRVPISVSLLFHTGLKFLCVPHQWQDDRVESAVICR